MITIRAAQLDVFANLARADFIRRVIVHWNSRFPETTVTRSDAELRELVKRGIERAQGFGIVAERDVCQFLDIVLVLGLDFDEDLA